MTGTMKYCRLMFVSAAAAVVIVGCAPDDAHRGRPVSQVGQESRAGESPHVGQQSRADEGLDPGEESKVRQEPGAEKKPQGKKKPQTGDRRKDGRDQKAGQDADTDEEPLLLLDDEPPLLLDDGPEGSSEATGPMADNSRCHVCHLNYAKEDIAVVHARAKIGCVDCHGDCDEHIADESWASGGNGTPPGIMYAPDKINPLCIGCHDKDEIDTEDHEEFLAGTADEKYCTDCHGDHRLPKRKCKWK